MNDAQTPKPKFGLPPTGISLGGLSPDQYDHTLKASDEAPTDISSASPAPRPPDAEPSQEPKPPLMSVPANEDQLGLPRGGLVAFRKSGGLRFTSRGFVVFRSGWVVPLEGTAGRPRQISAEAREAIEGLLLSSGLRRSYRKGKVTPDGYSYELTARYGGRTRYAETSDGAIPDGLARLIEVLQRLMPEA